MWGQIESSIAFYNSYYSCCCLPSWWAFRNGSWVKAFFLGGKVGLGGSLLLPSGTASWGRTFYTRSVDQGTKSKREDSTTRVHCKAKGEMRERWKRERELVISSLPPSLFMVMSSWFVLLCLSPTLFVSWRWFSTLHFLFFLCVFYFLCVLTMS